MKSIRERVADRYFDYGVQRHRCDYENVFEIGIGTADARSFASMRHYDKVMADSSAPGATAAKYEAGPGLRAWRAFFPNAKIWGFDVDKYAMLDKGDPANFRIETHQLSSFNKTQVDQFLYQHFRMS